MKKSILSVILAFCILATTPALAAESAPAGTPDKETQPVTFMTGDFYGKEIQDETDALDAIMSVIDQLGGTKNTVLNPVEIRPNENGMSVYTFRQLSGETAVFAAIVKLITDKENHVCAVSSSLVPGIEAKPLDEWAITAAEAEQVVRENTADRNLQIVEDATEQVLLPYIDDHSQFYYAWVVYTNNDNPDYDTAYTAHYVDEEGQYMFNMPVLQPGDTDSRSGEGALLAFLPFEEDTWTGTVTKHDGTTKELTVPVLKDKETGDIYLGDMQRKILCIDYADFDYKDTITIRREENGRFTDSELLIYDTFLRVYDLYDQTGWTGPDGDGTPTLLMMDMVDPDGNPIQNASYSGKNHGFQTFAFNRLDPDGECTDIIAHEFTHCLTETLMTNNLYFNEYGAINEAFSDICGNIIEAACGDTKDTSWLIQENGVQTLRSMSSPRDYNQPAYVWDIYYMPPVDSAFDGNDLGGVHIDSSLLNLVAYRLNQTGMPLEDQLYFWMNVSLAMTPQSNYADLIQIIPWCADMLGYSEYVPALEAAFAETGIKDLSLPEKPAEDFGRIQFALPFTDTESMHEVIAEFFNMDTETSYLSSPRKLDYMTVATVPAGRYMLMLIFFDDASNEEIGTAVYCEDGWEVISDGELQMMLMFESGFKECTVKSGEVVELNIDLQKDLLEKLKIN